jgi:hypothetical protein
LFIALGLGALVPLVDDGLVNAPPVAFVVVAAAAAAAGGGLVRAPPLVETIFLLF